MKKALFFLLTVSLLISCSKNELGIHINNAEQKSFVATIESFSGNNTKTSLSAENTILWSKGDRISVFQGAPVNSQYEVDGSCAGTSDGVFNFITDKGAGSGNNFTSVMEISANVAVYPYESELALISGSIDDMDSYQISNITVPSEQNYVENSFPDDAFIMVAVTDSPTDRVLKFKNVLGAMKLQFLGECKVKSIKIEGNKGEILSGKAQITAFKEGYLPVITMRENGTQSITLNCGEGVQLNPDKSTSFIIAMPPTHFEWGFKVSVTDTEENVIEISANSANTVSRSNILKMPERNLRVVNTENLDYIVFEDEVVEALCLNSFDTNEDGKLQFTEAASVTDIKGMNLLMRSIKSFNELKYFTSLTSIPDNYFQNQTQLTYITLPQGVQTIGNNAFAGCTALRAVNLLGGNLSIGKSAFDGCTSLRDINLSGGVLSIGERAFAECSSLNNINLPDGLLDIGKAAFLNCSSITEIVIPETYEFSYIKESAFEGCTSLRSVTSLRTITSVRGYAFRGCVSLVECDILQTAKSFDYAAFYGCTQLQEVRFRDGIYTIHPQAFEGCTALKKISFGEADEDGLGIGGGAFANCTSLTEVDFNSVRIRSIDANIFKGCTNLEEIEIPESLRFIPDAMFLDCTSLKTVGIPNSVTSIGYKAFAGCTSLKQLDIPSSVTEIDGYAFSECSGLGQISMPGVTQISHGTFLNCISIKKVFAGAVESIGSGAFAGCVWLRDLNFMSTVTSIEQYAFQDCAMLTEITLGSDVPQLGNDAFDGCSSLASIYVPSSSVDIYKASWADYANLIKAIPVNN